METPLQTCERFRLNLKGRILLMKHLQRLLHSKYKKPLMGQPAHYAKNVMEAAVIRGDTIELFDQLLNAATLILEEMGVLLPMYHKALFSDSAYAAVTKAAANLVAEPSYSQTKRLQIWRSVFHFAGIRWSN